MFSEMGTWSCDINHGLRPLAPIYADFLTSKLFVISNKLRLLDMGRYFNLFFHCYHNNNKIIA